MPSPWLLFSVIAACMVFGCLRVIGKEFETAVAWHDLRVRVQRMRREQQRRLETSIEHEPSLRRIHRGRNGGMPSLVRASEASGVGPAAAVVEPASAAVAEAVEVLEAKAF